MKLPTPDKRVVDGLSGNTLHLLYYVMGFTGCVAIVTIAYRGTTQYLDLVSVVAVLCVVCLLARYSHLSHKDSTEKISDSVTSLQNEVRDMSVHLREMNEHLKLTDLGDTIFGKESFQKVWRTLTLHTEDRFLAMSYMSPSEWSCEHSKSQIKVLGAMKSMSDSTITVRRLFVVESEDEVSELTSIFEDHERHQIEARWILRNTLVENSILSANDTDRGFNLSDESRGAVYHYDSDRKVLGGRLIYRPSDVKRYVGIFEKSWAIAKVPNLNVRNVEKGTS